MSVPNFSSLAGLEHPSLLWWCVGWGGVVWFTWLLCLTPTLVASELLWVELSCVGFWQKEAPIGNPGPRNLHQKCAHCPPLNTHTIDKELNRNCFYSFKHQSYFFFCFIQWGFWKYSWIILTATMLHNSWDSHDKHWTILQNEEKSKDDIFWYFSVYSDQESICN